MASTQRTLHHLLFVAGATLSVVSINPADAAVSIQIAVPGIVVDARDPYYYSPNPCEGCWYGEWGGRTGYHRGGGRPWEREHVERDHHGQDRGGYWRPATPQDLNDPNVKQNESGQIWVDTARHQGHR
jgi:hypothetical protein